MITIAERRRPRLGDLTPQMIQAALQRNTVLRTQIRNTAITSGDPGVDVSGQPVDMVPLAIAGLAGFAVGAAGIVALLRRKKGS